MTSVNRLPFGSDGGSGSGGGGSSGGGYNGEQCVIQLIPHLNLNASRLQQILQGNSPYFIAIRIVLFYLLYFSCVLLLLILNCNICSHGN